MRNGFDTLLQVVQQDQQYDLSFQLQDAAGVGLDLTDSTLVFKAQLDSDRDVNFSGSMAVVSASEGKCKYTVQPTDFSQPGTWRAQVVVTYGIGEVLTFTGITVQVAAKLPLS